MTKQNEIYKCEICGNIVDVLHTGAGALVCCGQPMKLMEESVIDAALEKHVPVIEKIETGVKVVVGSVDHPMDESHYIEWIEVVTETKRYKKFLMPNDKPEATFDVKEEVIKARAYCNLHGLWKS